MAFISYNKRWESEFDNIVSKKDKVQDLNITQMKLKVNDAYEKDEKKTTNFEPVDNSNVLNKAYLDKQISNIECPISSKEKNYNEFKLHNSKQSIEEVLIQRAV